MLIEAGRIDVACFRQLDLRCSRRGITYGPYFSLPTGLGKLVSVTMPLAPSEV